MTIWRLAGSVVPGSSWTVWPLRTPDADAHPEPGEPVVIGQRTATNDAVATALARLQQWVRLGGHLVAGAGIDLGDGFISARVEGGAGDRRDSVLAALRIDGLRDRLGDRRSVLTALFGAQATKPLGAAAQAALEGRRWPALRLAVAASDVLWPEQLVQVLELTAPPGIDPYPTGLPSATGRQLSRIFQRVPHPRRFDLLTDLWTRVCEDALKRQRSQRLRDSQGRRDRTVDLYARLAHYEEDELRAALGPRTTFTQIALWIPTQEYFRTIADRALHDALAATVLARLAFSAVDHGLPEAIEAHRQEIDAVLEGFSAAEGRLARRAIPELTGLPARPAAVLQNILRGHLAELRLARDYGEVAFNSAFGLIHHQEGLSEWAATPMAGWRHKVGHFSPHRLAAWEQSPVVAGQLPLARRAAESETVGDMFWLAELADSLARLNGHESAEVHPGFEAPACDTNPQPAIAPMVPKTESIALAVAGTAQLLDLGGRVPPRCRTWSELAGGLLDTAAIAEMLTGTFPLPTELAAAVTKPVAGARIEMAHSARQLAEWADYMGNCIAGQHYVDDASTGRIVLLALRSIDDVTILANAELRPTAHGWRVLELRGRFNQDPEPALVQHFRAWVRELPASRPRGLTDGKRERLKARRGPSPATRMVRNIGDQLRDAVASSMAEASSQHAVEEMARLGGANADPHDALTALRRAPAPELTRTVNRALSRLPELWDATSHRPLAQAIGSLGPSEMERLAPLLLDAPLPGALRRLARLPQIAPARTAHLMVLRVRRSLSVLIGQDAPELGRAVVARPRDGFVRAAALAVTSQPGSGRTATVLGPRRIHLPGYPASSLNDDSWQGAWPDACELGAVPEEFWENIAAHGLALPASWIETGGGWQVLWARAHSQ